MKGPAAEGALNLLRLSLYIGLVAALLATTGFIVSALFYLCGECTTPAALLAGTALLLFVGVVGLVLAVAGWARAGTRQRALEPPLPWPT